MDDEPLQTDEVDRFLRTSGECCLVHLPSGKVVVATGQPENKSAPWRVFYLHYAILDRPILEQALALGFTLWAWPTSSTSEHTVYELTRDIFGMRAAAIRALQLIRMLPDVPQDAWVWPTICESDQREEPPPAPPSPWPPLA